MAQAPVGAKDNADMRTSGLAASAMLACSIVLLAACSPALNWRTVQLKDAALQITLPCDPQAATRPVPMGPTVVQLSVLGCEAQGSTYAVSHFQLADPAGAARALGYWQQAVLNQLRSETDPGSAAVLQAQGDGPWVPKGALNLPQSRRITFEGLSSQGQKVTGHGLWFARIEGAGVRLYHAVIYGRKAQPAEVDMFFSGLQLQ